MNENRSEISSDRSHLETEKRLAESMNLDRLSIADALRVMNDQDAMAIAAVRGEAPAIERAVEAVSRAFSRGGSLIYVGAGTSGRLGVLDATECPPTFGVERSLVRGIIAGGEDAMFRSQEGAEDRAEGGAAAIDAAGITSRDVVMGIAAGGTTPFVRGALDRAKEIGATTVFLCCVQKNDAEPTADIVIRPITGPEVLTGSTRLKAGTATKLVLNQITTLAMVQMGKVYENLMVDLKASNAKLRDRSARIVSTICGIGREEAIALLERAEGNVKVAIVMRKRGVGRDEANAILNRAGGQLRTALEKM